MVPPGEAVIWRGPMLHSTITTFLRDVAWGDLDYLIIDMPPGTGDIALSLSQMLPLTGAVIVCTPQEVALIDAIKAVGMFRKVKIPVTGPDRKHEQLRVPRQRQRVRHLRQGWREEVCRAKTKSRSLEKSRSTSSFASEAMRVKWQPISMTRTWLPTLEAIAKTLCQSTG